jgi:hypothetical protein
MFRSVAATHGVIRGAEYQGEVSDRKAIISWIFMKVQDQQAHE